MASALATAAARNSGTGLVGPAADSYRRAKHLLRERYPYIDVAALEREPGSVDERRRLAQDLHRAGCEADSELIGVMYQLTVALALHDPESTAEVEAELREFRFSARRGKFSGSGHASTAGSLTAPSLTESWFTVDGLDVDGEMLPSVPLSPAQSAIWFAQRIRPDIPLTIAQYVEIQGDLDVGALLYAVERFGAETQIGQIRFVELDSVAHQLIDESCRPAWARLDLRAERDPHGSAVQWMTEHSSSPIDVERDPLITNVVLRVGDAHYIWYTRAHHLVIDGYGAMNGMNRTAEIYTATTMRQEPAPSRAAPLADIVTDDKKYRASSRFHSDRAYWLEQMADVDEPISLSDSAISAATFAADRRLTRGVLDARLQALLEDAARRHNSSAAPLVVAGVASYLRSITARSDVVLSLPVSARTTVALRRSAGMVSNVVPLRVRFGPDITLGEVIREAELQITGALRHQRYRHDDIRRDCGYARSVRGFFGPTVNIMLFHDELRFGDLLGQINVLSTGPVEDLSINLYNVEGDRLHLDFEANPTLYSRTEIDLHHARFLDFLRSFLAADGESATESITAITTAERTAVVHTWNATAAPHQGGTLASLFGAQAATDPHATALEYGNHRVTYGELDDRTNRLARFMIDHGAGPETVVGICLPRGIDLILAIYATIKTGAAYLPLDPEYPAERLSYCISDADPVFVVVHPDDTHTPSPGHLRLTLASCDPSAYDGSSISDTERRSSLRPDHLAYMIFTSGSTGMPKGVGVSHAAIVNRLRWMQHEYPLDATDAVLQKTPMTFDVSVWEFFWPLQVGARLVIAKPDGHRDPKYLAQTIVEKRVTVAHFVPSMLDLFITELSTAQTVSIRRVFCSGEVLPAATVRDARSVLSNTEIHNLYGPTEAAVDVTFWPCTEGADTTAIGSPVWNTQVYVLDPSLRPSPPGAVGELYLAGVQLARGYLGRQSLTADRFVANPFAAGSRMYRTGDLVRWRLLPASSARGVLEYVGRTDFQVKIRGQRIELGEIEQALRADTRVGTAICVVHNSRLGTSLVAYVVPEAGTDEADLPTSLTRSLRHTLPAHMVPTVLILLDQLPISLNGKIDRKGLPDPENYLRRTLGGSKPRTAVERLVAEMFEEVLGVEGVGADDSFFALGGNSLIATRVVTRINQALGSNLGIRDLFEADTVAELAARCDGATHAVRPRLRPAVYPERVPLAPAQQRLWILNRLAEHSSAYNMPLVVRFEGPLEPAMLRAALYDVIDRQQILRTTFPEHVDGPYQVIHPAAAVPLVLKPVDATDADIAALATEYAAMGFDLRSQPPLRATLLRTGTDRHVLIVVLHHICCDGLSVAPLVRDLEFALSARLTDSAPRWSPLAIQYADYALWQRELLGDDTDPRSILSAQLAHWRAALDGIPDQLDLPLDRPRTRRRSPEAGLVRFSVPSELRQAVDNLGRSVGVSTFMVVHAALAVLLARVCGSADITIGTPVAGRGEQELDDLVGMFVNTLTLRTEVDPAAEFTRLLEVVRTADLDAFANADAPFERLVEVVNPERSSTHHPLFQVVLSYEIQRELRICVPSIQTEILPTPLAVSKFDLEVVVRDDERGALAKIEFGYARDLFDHQTVESLGKRFLMILRAATQRPSTPVGDLDILDERESRAMVPIAGPPAEPAVPLHRLLSDTAARFPEAIALRQLGITLTYRELDERSNRLARALLTRGAGPERVIALALPRGIDNVVAIWAVAKTGAAYLPIDPSYPSERAAFMVDDSGAMLGLISSVSTMQIVRFRARSPQVPNFEWLTLGALSFVNELDDYSADPIRDISRGGAPRVDQLAYLIYTSGSSGEPKAVEITHAGLSSLAYAQRALFRISDSARTLHFSSPGFDASVLEMLLAFGAGATMVIAPTEVFGGAELAAFLRDERITHAFVTPAALATVPHEGLDELEVVIVGGEACGEGLVETWTAGHRMHNMYGPTEVTVAVTATAPMTAGQPVQLGSPVHGVRMYVLDTRLRPVPPGTVGELYLSGPGLARGYRGRPGLTAQCFPANPLGESGERMYRTGDMVVVDAVGAVRFLGRLDDQIKIRGFRIEVREIDQALLRHEGVTSAVTLVHTDEHGRRRLAAYVTVKGPVESADVLDYTRQSLPNYMVPASVTVIDEFPRTPVGKLDHHALPAPVFAPVSAAEAPRTDIEHALAAIFADVLGVEEVGRSESFFEIGGNSLIATQAVDRVADVLGPGLTVRDLFDAGTVAELARRFEHHRAEADLEALLLDGAALDHRRAPREAQVWCLSDEPVRPGQVARIGFAIAVPESAVAAPLAAESDRIPEPVRLRILLQSQQAFVQPVTHLAVLHVDRTTDPQIFEVVPERDGITSLTFRIYLDRDGQLLQEIVVALPVEPPLTKAVLP
ncbi:amino acid adenylation domain-containing protein [Nocardia fluminea]|uniref:amino acid adenylation domain-containing protein n=1 Tax=Nocardia fluminea TaxID=134984 RepID=UPI0033F52042